MSRARPSVFRLRCGRRLGGLLLAVAGCAALAACTPSQLKVSNAELGTSGHTLLNFAYAQDRREVYSTEDEKVTFAVRLGYNLVGYYTRFRVHWIAPTGATYLDARAATAWGSNQALVAELPIRGTPAVRLIGEWRVRLVQGERVLAERRFELLDARYIASAQAHADEVAEDNTDNTDNANNANNADNTTTVQGEAIAPVAGVTSESDQSAELVDAEPAPAEPTQTEQAALGAPPGERVLWGDIQFGPRDKRSELAPVPADAAAAETTKPDIEPDDVTRDSVTDVEPAPVADSEAAAPGAVQSEETQSATPAPRYRCPPLPWPQDNCVDVRAR